MDQPAAAAEEPAEDVAVPPHPEHHAHVSLPVEGMTCASCAARIENVLKRQDGVADAGVNLPAERADITYDPETVGPEGLARAIVKAGFMVPDRATELDIEGMTCAACASRLESVLNKVPGVSSASVNLATERATVEALPGAVSPADLIAAVRKAGYDAHAVSDRKERLEEEAAREARTNRLEMVRLGVGLVLALPLVLPMLLHPVGVDAALPGWAQFLLATPVQVWLGGRFYAAGFKALRAGSGNMDLLVALGTSAAYGLSLFNTFVVSGPLYYEAAAMVIVLVLIGRFLEGRARRSAAASIRSLMALRPAVARVERADGLVEVDAEAVAEDDIVVVRPGERVPVDGEVLDGESSLDESMITGESMPVTRGPEDTVTGGSINGNGTLRVRATRVGNESTLNRIIGMVEAAQASKAPVQRLVDRVAAVFVPAVIGVAVITFLVWWQVAAAPQAAFVAAVSVLVIACPCALGLATPAALMVGTGIAARSGILIKDAEALERAHNINTAILDKTGTLTEGRPGVTGIKVIDAEGEEELLTLAAAVQEGSEHPLARAVTQRALGITTPAADSIRSIPGRGLEGRVNDRVLRLGNTRLMRETGFDTSDQGERVDKLEARGRTVMWVAEVQPRPRLLGLISVSDPVKENAVNAVQRLKDLGITPVLLTGDNRRAAVAVAHSVGIDEVLAEVLPEDKAAEVQSAMGDDRVVAMVGDGVNDAPALAVADVGMAMGTGTDVAMHTAGVTLMRGNPELVADAVAISRATHRKIRQNLFWAFFYNVVAIPVAAAGLLNPVIAGAAMALSSVSVVSNALLLKRWRPQA